MRQSPTKIPNSADPGIEGDPLRDAKAALGEDDPEKEEVLLKGTGPMTLSGFDSPLDIEEVKPCKAYSCLAVAISAPFKLYQPL